ncbi:MAG: DUF177 domain-containing protein [Firmicutes bacterium]|nr:DUF177 domain-containing protein [Bacillota bacterium]
MKIDLNKLNIGDKININEKFIFNSNIYNNENIKGLKDVEVNGYIYYNSAEILEIKLSLSGVMMLVDSVTLDIIENPFNIEIDEEYSLNDQYFKEYYEKEQNILDIMAILWENIVLEVPISLTHTENVELSGDGWSMGCIENKEDNIDPRLAKLAELLDERKE